ncbi:MAG: winged helix-turn-helix transcriptional regulator [Candidatus Thalassarchaeaceae archaeon]|nr:winged helix-turn-helix transcriptional regulator [Candidatus Thalassarchaeaceae archaeon]
MSVKGESGHRGTMNGVSAVRVLTLFAIASLAAGGWLYQNNENGPASEEINEFNFDSAVATESGDSDGEAEGARAPIPEVESDDSASIFSDLSFGLIAGGAGTLGSLTIAAAVSEAIRVTVLVALLAPMLAMRGNGNDLLTRGRILGYLEANAGIHFSAMRDALGLANGVTAYHLHVLESQGEVISWRDGKLRRYAIASLSREEVGRIRNPIIGTRLAILEVIANSGNVGISGTEVRKKLEISRQLLSHHIRELRNAGMVEAAAEARRPPWRLSEAGQLALLSSLSVSSSEAAT